MKKLLLTLLLITLPFASFADWELIDTYQFSDVNLNTNPKTFNNLLGDKYDYKLITRLDAVDSDTASSELRMYFNNDDPTVPDNNYRYYEMHGTNATAGATVNNAQAFIPIANVGDANALYSSFSEFYIYGSSGNERLIEGSIAGYDTNAPYIYEVNGSYLTTADEITHINIYDETSQNTSGAIYLFRRLKKQYQGNDWELIEKQTVTAQDMNTTPVVFNNLLGDDDVEYKIVSEVDSASASAYEIRAYFNGDTTETNYKTQNLKNIAGVLGAEVLDNAQNIIGDMYTTNALGTFYFSPKSGQYQTSISKSYCPDATNGNQFLCGSWYEIGSNEITSITLKTLETQTSGITGTFSLYKRSKNRSSYGKRLIYDYDINGAFFAGQTFKNLKNDKMYEIVVSGVDDNVFIWMQPNSVSGSSSYQFLRGRATAVDSAYSSSTDFYLCQGNADYVEYSRTLLFPYNNGDYRCALTRAADHNGTNPAIINLAQWFNNNTDDITELKIFASVGTTITGNIKIYEIDLPEKTIDDLQPDMALWLDAKDASTITEDVGVSQWDDKSGNDNHAVQAVGANQPVYDTDKLVFDGTDDYLVSTFGSALSQPATYFIVHQWANADASQKFISDGIGVPNRHSIYRDTTPNYSMYSTAVFGSGISIDTNTHISLSVFNGASSLFQLDNGTEVTGNPGTNAVDGIAIGASYAGSLSFIGNIREIVVFDKELSENDRMVVMKYLSKKWNITIGE